MRSRREDREAGHLRGAGSVRHWRDVAYAFVDIEQVDVAASEACPLLQLAITEGSGEPDLSVLIDSGRPGWLPPRRPLERAPAALPVRLPIEVCPDVRRRLRGRVVVVHGRGFGWPLLAATCSPLRPLAVLDSLSLVGELLPGGGRSLTELMERLDVRLTEDELRGPGARECVRNARVLSRVFERMVERTRPWTTADALVHLAGRRGAEPLPDLGLEDGR